MKIMFEEADFDALDLTDICENYYDSDDPFLSPIKLAATLNQIVQVKLSCPALVETHKAELTEYHERSQVTINDLKAEIQKLLDDRVRYLEGGTK